MTEILYVCLAAVLLVILIDSWAWLALRISKDVPGPEPLHWPLVAVLLPVRNEEEQLPGCLQSLLRLNYPQDKLIILLGNDASTDNTLAIARKWQEHHPCIRVHNIENELGLARGKANVLAQLVHHCPPEVGFFLMTDADIRPHPQWVRRMLRALKPGIGIVNGTTTVAADTSLSLLKRVWARFQQADWAIALGLVKAYTYLPLLGNTLTAIGNNMLISREAYLASGGYESFPFSITEDYELQQQVSRQGFGALQLMDEESSARTMPVLSLGTLLHQRKRWMTGAMRLPLPMVFLLLMKALFFPAILLVLWLEPIFGMSLLLIKLLLQLLLAKRVLQRTGVQELPQAGLFYEFYSFFVSSMLIMFYILPLKINWKGRTYSNNRA